MTAAEYCRINYPIFLATLPHSASDSESAPDTAANKYHFLVDGSFDYLATERVHVSDLKEAALAAIRRRKEYADRLDTDFWIRIYEVRLVCRTRSTCLHVSCSA